MGMDVMYDRGVILDIDQMIGLLRSEEVSNIGVTIIEMIPIEGSTVPSDIDPSLLSYYSPFSDFLDEEVTDYNNEEAFEKAYKKALKDTVTKAESNWSSESHEFLWSFYSLWKALLFASWGSVDDFWEKFPASFDEVRVFENPRECGYEVPIGKICFVFGSHALWERKLSEKGKEFEKLVGKIDEVKWTSVSY